MIKKIDTVILVFILISLFLFRLPFSSKPVLNIDESIYLYIAKDCLDGGVPYKTAFDHKGPVMFFLFVPVIYLFGNSITAIRIYTTIYLLVTIIIIYLMANKITKNKTIALIAPLIYGIFFNILVYEGLTSNGELFMMLPISLAFYFYFLSKEKQSNLNLFISGLFTMLAFLIKATSFFTLLTIPLILFFYKFSFKELKNKIKNIAFYSFGVLFVLTIFLIYFIVTDSLKDFIFSFFTVNNLYVKDIPASEGLWNFFIFMISTIKYEPITLTVLIILIITPFLKNVKREKEIQLTIFLLTVLSFIAVYWGKVMYNHYYLQMALPYSLTITYFTSLLFSCLKKEKIKSATMHIVKIMPIFLCTIFFLAHINIIKEAKKTTTFERELYAIVDYIKNNTQKEEKIFILGGEPIIYFLSERKAPTKYFSWMHHSERFVPILWQNKHNPFPQEKPKYIIYEKGYMDIKPFFNLINNEYKIEKEIGNSIIFVKKNS